MTHLLRPYVDKLNNGEPFTSLLWGDGEFVVASRSRTGCTMQNGEVVTRQLEDELRASLLVDDATIIRGTDLNLIYPDHYQGQDIDSVRFVSKQVHRTLHEVCPNKVIEWADGTVWDTAVREGQLGPLLKALSGRTTVMVGNSKLLSGLDALKWSGFHSVPSTNACSELDNLERWLGADNKQLARTVFVICIGLGAIPLIMRLRRYYPLGTFLDLGSMFDVFAGIGAERGWRQEVYADKAAWADLIAKNLEGSA